MKFCTQCNQERPADTRFCVTCGTELTDEAAGQSTDTFTIQRPQGPAATQAPEGSPDETQSYQPAAWDAADATQVDAFPPVDQHTPPEGFTAPGQYPPPAQYQEWGGYQEPTLYQEPVHYHEPPQYPPAGYVPPDPGDGPYSPAPGLVPGLVPGLGPGPGPGQRSGQRSGRGRAAALVAAAIAIILIAAAGAYAVASSLRHSGHTASPPPTHPASATSAAATPTTPAPTTASPTPTPSPTASGPVAFAPGVASNPKAQKVENLFTAYFSSINSHNYAQFASSLDAAMQAKNPQSKFDSGYATTSDSSEKINSITTSGSGLNVVITFTSHQAPADSPDDSACNKYNLTLPLVPKGPGYVITVPPTGYASWTDC